MSSLAIWQSPRATRLRRSAKSLRRRTGSRSGCGPRPAGLATAAIAVLTLGLAPGRASAEPPPYDPSINLQLFEYAIGPHSFLTVADADVPGDRQFNVDFMLTFLTDPFTIYNVEPGEDEISGTRTGVVESLLAGEISGAYGFRDDLQLSLALPMVFSITGDGLDPTSGGASADGIQATGTGDMRFELKWRFWQRENLRFAVIPGATIPTSFGAGGSDYLGDDLPTLRARGVVQWTDPSGKFTVGGNLGAVFRKPRTIYSSEVGQQLTYNAAASVKASSKVDLIGEIFGRAGFTDRNADANPIEVAGGVRVQATKSISVVAGGGAGLSKGIGSPAVRMFMSVGWAPDYRDQDLDGIVNAHDDCPLLPEDKDGFEDSDGCPEEDNDKDRREDAIDKCPNEAEDLDGFEDEDGCPEKDNDGDGFVNAEDRCPNHKEDGAKPYDKDGCPADRRDSDDDTIMDAADQCPDEPEDADEFEDWDGCPDVDNDGDDHPDDYDNCPLCAEDKDGFEDDDGCPEPDNDKDGILDADDKCAGEPETPNGVSDFDGCPDKGDDPAATLKGDRIVMAEEIALGRKRKIKGANRQLLDQVALIMLREREIGKWRIVVAAPRQRTEAATRKLSQAQADAVKEYLVSRNVAASALESIGAVSDSVTVVFVVVERLQKEEAQARSCPATSRAVPRPPPAAPAAPAAPAGPAPADTPVEPTETGSDKTETAADKAPAARKAAKAKPTPAPPPPKTPRAKPASRHTPADLLPFKGVVAAIQFKRDAPVLRKKSRKTLDKLAEVLKQYEHVTMAVHCHTDNRLGPKRGKAITKSQAEVITSYLIDKGVPARRLNPIGHGMDDPIANNRTKKGRKENRRVELVFFD